MEPLLLRSTVSSECFVAPEKKDTEANLYSMLLYVDNYKYTKSVYSIFAFNVAM